MNYSNFITVYELTGIIKNCLENDLRLKNILIKGEISNLKIHTTGHWYFTLKDARSKVNAVMFASHALNCKIKVNEGMQVIVSASIGVYEASGNYQLYVTSIQPDGLGLLYLQYEELKKKLHLEGLFDNKYKIAIPKFPKKIGIISASTGAAIHDILTTIARRWPICQRVLIPSLVQGRDAASSIVKSLVLADTLGFDVIILARGGGSLEDLWPFNEEIVARAIFNMKTPIISGVGHEVDFTISDYVADCRAPTPTGAAEMVTPNIYEVTKTITKLKSDLIDAFMLNLTNKKQKLSNLKDRNIFKNIDYLYVNQTFYLDSLSSRLANAKQTLFSKLKEKQKAQLLTMERIITNKIKSFQTLYQYQDKLKSRFNERFYDSRNNFKVIISKLEALSPLKIIARGYLIAQKDDKKMVKSIKDVKVDDKLFITLQDGIIQSKIEEIKEN